MKFTKELLNNMAKAKDRSVETVTREKAIEELVSEIQSQIKDENSMTNYELEENGTIRLCDIGRLMYYYPTGQLVALLAANKEVVWFYDTDGRAKCDHAEKFALSDSHAQIVLPCSSDPEPIVEELEETKAELEETKKRLQEMLERIQYAKEPDEDDEVPVPFWMYEDEIPFRQMKTGVPYRVRIQHWKNSIWLYGVAMKQSTSSFAFVKDAKTVKEYYDRQEDIAPLSTNSGWTIYASEIAEEE